MRTLSIIKNLLVLFFICTSIYTQNSNLYIPLNIQKAYEKGTRSQDGKPGDNYWQNHSEYKIKAYFDPGSGELTGSEKITYYNESPDSLDQIVIRLYQNMTKPEAIRDFPISKDVISDGVDIKQIKINGVPVNLVNRSTIVRDGTVWTINLSRKLAPDDEMELSIDWSFTIMKGRNVRMGYYADSTYFVAYWYPQIAVYDDVDGWDKIGYTGEAEFYNDFSDFDVEIHVPQNITVWAAGVLQNPGELLLPEYLERYKSAQTSDNIVRIFKKEDLKKKRFAGGDTITWKYKAKHVPDFAFAVAGRYLWDAVSITADENSGRRVLINTAYDPASADFYEVAAIARKTIDLLANDFPGVKFPYPSMTVFNGSGGMEFPMMVNNGSFVERRSTIHVTSHEITHTYFPFYMGTNEKKYAWMDEGWAVMIPFEMQNLMQPDYDPVTRNTNSYLNDAGKENEIIPMTPSYFIKSPEYRTASYYRPAEAYKFLRETLGKEKFDEVLREYIERWNGKHPMPYDFFYTFEDELEEDLSWFWKPWFFERGYPDLAIKDVKINKEKIEVVVEKVGNIPVPVMINVHFRNDSTVSVKKDINVWKSGQKEILVEIENISEVDLVELGSSSIPDINVKNNFYYVKKSSGK